MDSDSDIRPWNDGRSTVLARLPLSILLAMEARGIPSGELLGAIGLDLEALEEEDARIEVSKEQELWHACGDSLGRPLRGMEVLSSVPPGFLGFTDMLFSTAATFGEALQVARDFMPLVREGLSMDLSEIGSTLQIAYNFDDPMEQLALGSIESFLGVVLIYGSFATGKSQSIQQLSLPPEVLDEPEALAEVSAAFGTDNIYFDAVQPIVWVPRSIQNLPQRTAAPRLHAILRAHASELLQARGRSAQFLLRVRHLMLLDLEHGEVSLESLARRMCLSERSMQRQLALHGCSFGELREALRRDLAVLYLRNALMTLAEISYRLGYRSTQAFHRAFQGWYGVSPGTWRKAHAWNMLPGE